MESCASKAAGRIPGRAGDGAALIAGRAPALIVRIVTLKAKGYLFIVGEYFTAQNQKQKGLSFPLSAHHCSHGTLHTHVETRV